MSLGVLWSECGFGGVIRVFCESVEGGGEN